MVRWTERQRALLQEIGIRVWPLRQASARDDAAALAPVAGVPSAKSRAPSADAVVAGSPAEGAGVSMAAAAAGGDAPATAPAHRTDAPRGAEDFVAMDWPALRAAAANCRACALCQGRSHSVFGAGHPRAHWMIVGDAPAEADDATGEPFSGRAGQLLDNMLRAIQLTRAAAPPSRQVYLANAVKCQPLGGRNPEPAELEQCAGFLLRQVQLVQPRIIVAMGRFAAQSLLQSSEPIGRLRGRVHRCSGVPLIATYHPAYLLRNPEDKARAWDDLCLAVQTLKAGTPG